MFVDNSSTSTASTIQPLKPVPRARSSGNIVGTTIDQPSRPPRKKDIPGSDSMDVSTHDLQARPSPAPRRDVQSSVFDQDTSKLELGGSQNLAPRSVPPPLPQNRTDGGVIGRPLPPIPRRTEDCQPSMSSQNNLLDKPLSPDHVKSTEIDPFDTSSVPAHFMNTQAPNQPVAGSTVMGSGIPVNNYNSKTNVTIGVNFNLESPPHSPGEMSSQSPNFSPPDMPPPQYGGPPQEPPPPPPPREDSIPDNYIPPSFDDDDHEYTYILPPTGPPPDLPPPPLPETDPACTTPKTLPPVPSRPPNVTSAPPNSFPPVPARPTVSQNGPPPNLPPVPARTLPPVPPRNWKIKH